MHILAGLYAWAVTEVRAERRVCQPVPKRASRQRPVPLPEFCLRLA